MTRVLIWGIGGRLGNSLTASLQKSERANLVGGVDKFCDCSKFDVPVFKTVNEIDVEADVIIDFSRPDSVYDILPYANKHKLNVVLATTGYSAKDEEFINAYSDKLAIFKASNMSLGINLLIDLARRATRVLGGNFDIEIVETHHHIKVDSPSGTALTIANAINEEFEQKKEFVFGRHGANERRKESEIGIHSIRGGSVVGKHEVMFLGNDEVLTITHEAASKTVLAEGAINAALFLCNKSCGKYDMLDLLKD